MQIKTRKSHTLIFIMAILFAGCTPKIDVLDTNSPDYRQFKAHQQQLKKIDDFTLKGKVGVKTGSEGGSARINWAINNQPFNQYIELYGPFGGGRIIIESNDNGATLRDAKGDTQSGSNTEELLAKRLGWRIPFSQLRAWAKGMPADAADRIKLDEQGLLSMTGNDIWTVDYSQYQQIGDYTLPRKLEIVSRAGAMQFYNEDGEFLADQISIKVIIQSWQDL